MGGLSGSGVRNQINEALETSWNDIDGIGEVKGGLDRLTGGGWFGAQIDRKHWLPGKSDLLVQRFMLDLTEEEIGWHEAMV